MTRLSALWSPRLADLLLMASTASAISLSNFQFLVSNGIPLGCIVAYNNEIAGCDIFDFTVGSTCSDACVRGIETTVTNILSACDFVEVEKGTVLDVTMNGDLLSALCPDDDEPQQSSTATSTSAISTRSTATTTTSQTTATTSQTTATTSQTTTSATLQTVTSTPTPASPTPQAPTGDNGEEDEGDDGNDGDVRDDAEGEDEDTDDGNGDDNDDDDNTIQSGGGGSPFDPVQVVSSGTNLSLSGARLLSSATIAVAAANWLL